MANLILLNKPFGVICQFRAATNKTSLAEFIKLPGFYPAGRLDENSEGLVLLTDDARLQARISDPRYKLPKTYWAQVEGEITPDALHRLATGVDLKDGMTKTAKAKRLKHVPLPPRNPPIRYRAQIPTSWISLILTEGKNRQVRRMTAAVGFPTLRLFRSQVGSWKVDDIGIGHYKMLKVNLPVR